MTLLSNVADAHEPPAGRSIQGAQPLSFNQSSHLVLEWLAQLRAPTTPAVRPLVVAFYLEGRPDVSALQYAVNQLVGRHDILRTVFPDPRRLSAQQEKMIAERLALNDLSAGWVLRQHVLPTAPVVLSVVPAERTDTAVAPLKEQLGREITRPFDYSTPPLMRATLFEIEPERYLLLVVFHHLVADFWSLGVAADELTRSYNDRVTGQPPRPLGDVLQYGDFALAERQRFSGPLGPEAQDYWRQQWGRFGAARVKPGDLPIACKTIPPKPESRWDAVMVDRPLSDAVRAAARAHRVTTYMLCVTAMAILFHAYTRKSAVAWWGYCANRAETDRSDAIGWFAQGRTLGAELNVNDRASTVLGRIRRMVCDGDAYQDVPLQVLWQTLNMTAIAGAGLEQEFIAFNVVPERPQDRLADGVLIRPVPPGLTAIEAGRALKLWASEGRAGLATLSCSYSTAWFDRARIGQLLDDFKNVLAALVAQPEIEVSALASRVTLH